MGVEITLKTGESLERGIDFHILMKIAPRVFYGTILVSFGVILEAQGLLFGAGEPVVILMYFGTCPGGSQIEGTRSVGGEACVPGSSR